MSVYFSKQLTGLTHKLLCWNLRPCRPLSEDPILVVLQGSCFPLPCALLPYPLTWSASKLENSKHKYKPKGEKNQRDAEGEKVTSAGGSELLHYLKQAPRSAEKQTFVAPKEEIACLARRRQTKPQVPWGRSMIVSRSIMKKNPTALYLSPKACLLPQSQGPPLWCWPWAGDAASPRGIIHPVVLGGVSVWYSRFLSLPFWRIHFSPFNKTLQGIETMHEASWENSIHSGVRMGTDLLQRSLRLWPPETTSGLHSVLCLCSFVWFLDGVWSCSQSWQCLMVHQCP